MLTLNIEKLLIKNQVYVLVAVFSLIKALTPMAFATMDEAFMPIMIHDLHPPP